jgi:hypothetical protein
MTIEELNSVEILNLNFKTDLIDSPDSYFLTEMLSKNNGIDNRGFLVCTQVIAARTGVQQYYGREIGVLIDSMKNDIFYLERSADEVFHPDAIKSFNNAPFVDNHPTERIVNLDNYKNLAKGYATNARKADFKDKDGNELLLVDVVVTDKESIKLIQKGKKQISAGYSWKSEIVNLDKRIVKVKDIRANHLALVDHGRAGSTVILDNDNIEPLFINDKKYEGGESMSDVKPVHKFAHEDKIYQVQGIENKDEARKVVTEFLKESKENKEEK